MKEMTSKENKVAQNSEEVKDMEKQQKEAGEWKWWHTRESKKESQQCQTGFSSERKNLVRLGSDAVHAYCTCIPCMMKTGRQRWEVGGHHEGDRWNGAGRGRARNNYRSFGATQKIQNPGLPPQPSSRPVCSTCAREQEPQGQRWGLWVTTQSGLIQWVDEGNEEKPTMWAVARKYVSRSWT